jgi:hypothetical protein
VHGHAAMVAERNPTKRSGCGDAKESGNQRLREWQVGCPGANLAPYPHGFVPWRRSAMQVLCTSANGNAETYCCICGQGFVMFWERQSRRERAAAIREIQDSLRQHHRDNRKRDAHPQNSFFVPERDCSSVGSGAAVRGCAPSWAL